MDYYRRKTSSNFYVNYCDCDTSQMMYSWNILDRVLMNSKISALKLTGNNVILKSLNFVDFSKGIMFGNNLKLTVIT